MDKTTKFTSHVSWAVWEKPHSILTNALQRNRLDLLVEFLWSWIHCNWPQVCHLWKFQEHFLTFSWYLACGGFIFQFPLLSKCKCIRKLLTEAQEYSDEVTITDFPGGAECFEMCAKFCYGIAFTLSAHNLVEVCCGAKYLEMTEEMENGNLSFKLEVFLNSSILRSWKDAIICLQTCNAHMPWAEDLKVKKLLSKLL